MPISILGYNGSPNSFKLKVDYVEAADAAYHIATVHNADTGAQLVPLGQIAAGDTSKTYNTVTVASTVNKIFVRMVSFDAAGNQSAPDDSEAVEIDRTPPAAPIV